MKTLLKFQLMLMSCSIIACTKQDGPTIQPKEEQNFIATGNYTPSEQELKSIKANLLALNNADSTTSKKMLSNFNNNNSANSSRSFSNNNHKRVLSVSNPTPGDYLNITLNIIGPSDWSGLSPGSITNPVTFDWHWVVATNMLGFFDIISHERCDLNNYGPSGTGGSLKYTFARIQHQGSGLTGVYFITTWTERVNFQYFNRNSSGVGDGSAAFFRTGGDLIYPGAGGRYVINERYAVAEKVAGEIF